MARSHSLLPLFLTSLLPYYSTFYFFAFSVCDRTGSSFLSADRSCRFHLGVAADGGTHTGATGNAESLIQQHFFECREEQKNVGFLAAVAHQSHAPDLAFHGAESAGDFDIEFVEQLVAHLRIVNAAGNHHGGDGRQAIRRLSHKK